MNREELHDEFMRLCEEHTKVHEEFMACHFWQIRKSHRLFKQSHEIYARSMRVFDELHPGPFTIVR